MHRGILGLPLIAVKPAVARGVTWRVSGIGGVRRRPRAGNGLRNSASEATFRAVCVRAEKKRMNGAREQYANTDDAKTAQNDPNWSQSAGKHF